MKGTLQKTNIGWVIREYKENEKEVYESFYPVHPDSVLPLDKENREVDYEITQEYVKEKNYTKVLYYAYIVNPIENNQWDIIFEMLQDKFDVYLPIRSKNYIKNKFNPPKEKKG